MTKLDIIKYVQHTPNNTNNAILLEMLDQLGGEGGGKVDLAEIEPKDHTLDWDGNRNWDADNGYVGEIRSDNVWIIEKETLEKLLSASELCFVDSETEQYVLKANISLEDKKAVLVDAIEAKALYIAEEDEAFFLEKSYTQE